MVDIEKLYNELMIKYDDVMSKLEEYETKIIPKYRPNEELYCYNSAKKERATIKVDEVWITRNGIQYVEYINETKFRLFPESACFKNKIDLENYIKLFNQENKEHQ